LNIPVGEVGNKQKNERVDTMALHKELLKDLPPAKELLNNYQEFINQAKDADGYYSIVQFIAEKYGDKAYQIAEEFFKENGMNFNSEDLRTTDKIRKVGYAFEGINVNHIIVKKYTPDMLKHIVNTYNIEIRKVSQEFFMTEDYFERNITQTDGLFVAFNDNNQTLGFIHCCSKCSCDGSASVDAIFFKSGRIHAVVGKKLMEEAIKYFDEKGIRNVELLKGCFDYPFYKDLKGDAQKVFKEKLKHIWKVLKLIE